MVTILMMMMTIKIIIHTKHVNDEDTYKIDDDDEN